jgi:hypothetical protein
MRFLISAMPSKWKSRRWVEISDGSAPQNARVTSASCWPEPPSVRGQSLLTTWKAARVRNGAGREPKAKGK